MQLESLRTKDIDEAKVAFALVAAAVAKRWDALSVDPGRLTAIKRWAIAGEYYRWFVERHTNRPLAAATWKVDITIDIMRMKREFRRPSTPGTVSVVLNILPEFLVERGIPLDQAGLLELATADPAEVGSWKQALF